MNTEFKKLANKPVWASNAASTDRHEISDATPAITRTAGFSKFYSLPKGSQVEYQTMNQILRETSAAAKEVVNGVPQWDSEVPYLTGATTFYNGSFYIALRNNANSIPSANPTRWERVNEFIGRPAPVRDVEFDVSDPTAIKVKWAQGKDNGSLVSFQYAWRFESGSGTAQASTEYSNLSINGAAYDIPDGDELIISITPRNSDGNTPTEYIEEWRSPVIRFTAPAGGRDLPLAAGRGNQKALLSWTPPTNTGGRPITGYDIQWKTTGEAYSNANSAKVGVQTTYSVTGLINGVNYQFRVRAINIHGAGDWSNEANTTPVSTYDDADFPTLGAPDVDRKKNRISATTNITPSSTAPTYGLRSVEWNYRKEGEKGWRTQTTSVNGGFWKSGLGPGNWDVRYRLLTSVGYTPWSPSTRTSVGTEAPPPPKAWCRYLHTGNRNFYPHQTITLVSFDGDGGSPIWEVEIRGEHGPVGASYYFNSPPGTGVIRLSHPIEANTGEAEKTLRTMYNNEDVRLWIDWGSYGDGNSQFTIFVRARNQYGWGDWAEGNTIIQGD